MALISRARGILVAIVCFLSIVPAAAETRVAFVIGSSAYQNAPRLPNPSTDAADVAAAPKRSSFETSLVANSDKTGMDKAMVRFARAAHEAEAGSQRAVLYDEDPNTPQGRQYVGTVRWRTEFVAAPNSRTDTAIRADIEVPSRLFATLSLRRNLDSSLPASHTIEMAFRLLSESDGGGVASLPGVLLKSGEQARGTPLAGHIVEVSDNSFLVGLSDLEADRVRNIALLKERAWFDIPFVYANNKRAILALEKGPTGEAAFADALQE